MLALLPTDGSDPLVKLGEEFEPSTAPDEALIQVEAFSIAGLASRMPSQLDFFEFFARTGATIRHFDHDDSAVPDSRDLATLVRLVANDRLHPKLGVVADWTQTASVLEDLRERRIRGNAVLRVVHENGLPTTRPGDEK